MASPTLTQLQHPTSVGVGVHHHHSLPPVFQSTTTTNGPEILGVAPPQSAAAFPHEAARPEEYARAAAQARRNRRLALQQKQRKQQQPPQNNNNNTTTAIGANHAYTATTTANGCLVIPNPSSYLVSDDKKLHSLDRSSFPLSTSDDNDEDCWTVFHSDCNGLAEIARRLLAHRQARSNGTGVRNSSFSGAVAIPTECTYELLCAYRPTTAVVASVATTLRRPHAHVYISDLAVLDTDRFWKHLLVKKSYAIRSSKTTQLNRCVSAGKNHKAAGTAFCRKTDSKIRSASLGNLGEHGRGGWSSPVLNNKRTSLLGNSSGSHSNSGSTTVVAAFNESVQILRRIESKVWPGPVIINIEVSQPIPGLTIPLLNGTNQTVHHYMSLRKPCHPLAVKVCRDFYNYKVDHATHHRQSYDSNGKNTPPSSPVLVSASPPTTPLPNSTLSRAVPISCGGLAVPSLTTSWSSTGSRLDLALAPKTSETATTTTTITAGVHLLVGSSMLRKPTRSSTERERFNKEPTGESAFITLAQQALDQPPSSFVSSHQMRQVGMTTAILHGEEQREIFAVPTCEHGQPWHVTIWIDASTRTVHLESDSVSISPSTTTKGASPMDLQSTPLRATSIAQFGSPDNVVGGNASALVTPWNTSQTEMALLQAIRSPKVVVAGISRSDSMPTNVGRQRNVVAAAKERILQAVMMQWKVVATATEDCQ